VNTGLNKSYRMDLAMMEKRNTKFQKVRTVTGDQIVTKLCVI